MFAVYIKASDHILTLLLECLVQEHFASCIKVPYPADFIRNGASRTLWEATIGALCSSHPGNLVFFGGLPPYDVQFFAGLGIARIHVADNLVVSIFEDASDQPVYLDQTCGTVRVKLRMALETVVRRAQKSPAVLAA